MVRKHVVVRGFGEVELLHKERHTTRRIIQSTSAIPNLEEATFDLI
jgi:hypothetical protein